MDGQHRAIEFYRAEGLKDQKNRSKKNHMGLKLGLRKNDEIIGK